MKKLLFVLSVASLMLVSVGCASIHNNKAACDAPNAVIVPEKYQAQTELMNNGKPVTAEITGYEVLGFIQFGIPATYADRGDMHAASFGDYAAFKKAATYVACQNAGCDSLLDARYVIKDTNYYFFGFKIVKCAVTGVPVKVTGYKKL